MVGLDGGDRRGRSAGGELSLVVESGHEARGLLQVRLSRSGEPLARSPVIPAPLSAWSGAATGGTGSISCAAAPAKRGP
jgi:hypothetical protein